jgi:transcriptional regulator with PAS, ATPase and Fis domain
LDVLSITIPPLRERGEDIAILANYFLNEVNQGRPPGLGKVVFDPNAIDRLVEHSWPGNVRELRNVIHRTVFHSEDSIIRAKDLQLISMSLPEAQRPAQDLSSIKGKMIDAALSASNGNVSRAAQLLGIGKTTLYRHLSKIRLQSVPKAGAENACC